MFLFFEAASKGGHGPALLIQQEPFQRERKHRRKPVRLQGPNQALLVPDTRGERTRFQVMSEEHYNAIFQR